MSLSLSLVDCESRGALKLPNNRRHDFPAIKRSYLRKKILKFDEDRRINILVHLKTSRWKIVTLPFLNNINPINQKKVAIFVCWDYHDNWIIIFLKHATKKKIGKYDSSSRYITRKWLFRYSSDTEYYPPPIYISLTLAKSLWLWSQLTDTVFGMSSNGSLG